MNLHGSGQGEAEGWATWRARMSGNSSVDGDRFNSQAQAAYIAGIKRRQDPTAIQYTLRNVPPGLDRALRQRAKQLSRSLNEVAIEAMTRGAGVPQAPVEQQDVDILFGSWVEDPDVDQALSDQRKVDPDLWS